MTDTETTITAEQAIALGKTRFWESMSPRDIAVFQMEQPLLCMPFGVFHEAVETALGRPVWTHEFAGERLRDELFGHRPRPSMREIIELIPADKRVVVELP